MNLVYAIDGLGTGGAQRQMVELACETRRATDWSVRCLMYHEYDFHATRLRDCGVTAVCIPKRRRLDLRARHDSQGIARGWVLHRHWAEGRAESARSSSRGRTSFHSTSTICSA